MHSIIRNQILVIIYEEFGNNFSKTLLCCTNLIDPLQSDPRVITCEIEGMIGNTAPKLIPLDRRRLYRNSQNTPCGNNCSQCANYETQCVGCPGSKHYVGKFIF